jgi:hypothetical protein
MQQMSSVNLRDRTDSLVYGVRRGRHSAFRIQVQFEIGVRGRQRSQLSPPRGANARLQLA